MVEGVVLGDLDYPGVSVVWIAELRHGEWPHFLNIHLVDEDVPVEDANTLCLRDEHFMILLSVIVCTTWYSLECIVSLKERGPLSLLFMYIFHRTYLRYFFKIT